jgi:HNH endonuclease
MIRLTRIPLDGKLSARLEHRTTLLKQREADSRSARRSWKGAALERQGVKQALSQISVGVERCMYCGDSRGTDIDHFEPISFSPLRAFDWNNHLLACQSCNSNAKRDVYPCDNDGKCLLIDPSVEDPADHLQLTLSVGEYTATTRKGCVTIDVFQLNRGDLRRGREMAFARCKSMLRDYLNSTRSGRIDDANDTRLALEGQPFADVLHAMYRVIDMPGAELVLGGPEVLEVLRTWRNNVSAPGEP